MLCMGEASNLQHHPHTSPFYFSVSVTNGNGLHMPRMVSGGCGGPLRALP